MRAVTAEAYPQALALLGPQAVLLPIQPGTKAAAVKGWQHLDLLQTSEASYRRRIRYAATIAALLGPASRDLVAVDFDTNEAADEFLSLNPTLKQTLRTRGARGCVLWLIVVGPYPSQCQVLRDGMDGAVGEWRGGGCYSIISGVHPSGDAYSVLVAESPMVLEFRSLRWPPNWRATPALGSPGMDERTTEIQSEEGREKRKDRRLGTIQKTASSIGYSDRIKKKTLAAPFESGDTVNRQVIELYEMFIEPRWQAKKGGRNQFVCMAVPFLFSAMCETAVMAVVMRFYDKNHLLFKDSRIKHQYEAEEHLANVAERYTKSLKAAERTIYSQLGTERKRAAFRICRALAARPSVRNECDEGVFFLAYGNLGTRLLIDGKGASKLMCQFIRLGTVELVTKGRKWEQNLRPLATRWRYCL